MPTASASQPELSRSSSNGVASFGGDRLARGKVASSRSQHQDKDDDDGKSTGFHVLNLLLKFNLTIVYGNPLPATYRKNNGRDTEKRYTQEVFHSMGMVRGKLEISQDGWALVHTQAKPRLAKYRSKAQGKVSDFLGPIPVTLQCIFDELFPGREMPPGSTSFP